MLGWILTSWFTFCCQLLWKKYQFSIWAEQIGQQNILFKNSDVLVTDKVGQRLSDFLLRILSSVQLVKSSN